MNASLESEPSIVLRERPTRRFGDGATALTRVACLVAAMLAIPTIQAKAQPSGPAVTSGTVAPDQQTAHLRELADQASHRAAEYDELAKKARETAAKSTDPIIRKGWEDGAREHEARAKEQRDEAARLNAQADGRTPSKTPGAVAPAPKATPPTPPSLPSPVAVGNSAKPVGDNCAATETTLPVNKIEGHWRSDDGKETVEITLKRGETSKFVFKGHFEWDGSYQGGKLIFTRTPKANEMGEVAPSWAREKVAGTLKWSLELEAKTKCGVPRLEGNWFPGVVKFLQEKDATGKIVKQEASVAGRGKPVEVKYTRDAPAIAGAFVLEQQTGFTAAGKPKKPYPFQASVSPNFAEPIRTIFVYGFDLPKDKIEITSEDPAIDYSVIAVSKLIFGSPENLADPQKALIVKGWNQVMAPLDANTALIAKDMDSVLIQAHLRPRALLPGIKHFALNGIDGSWRLRFGDDRAAPNFAREITSKMYDPTTSLLLPERFVVEVRTDGDFPLDVIPLKLQLGKSPITWNGKATLAARKVPRDVVVDRLRKDKGEEPLPTVYRTDSIDLLEKDQKQGPPVVGRYYLKAKLGDNLLVTLEDQTIFGAMPPDISAPILRNPDVLGMTWKDALTRAARANGVEIQDWKQLTGADATRISNLIVTKSAASIAKQLVPFASSTLSRDDFTAHVRITVGDHAALLLFRDEFVKQMKAAIKSLEQVQGDEALRGYRKSIGHEIWEDGSPWQYLEVTCPKGGKCPFYRTFDPDFLGKEFGANIKEAEKWSLKAVQEGIGEYKKKAVEASDKAAGVADSDVGELVRLLGHGYDALLPSLVPRMMRLVDLNSNDEIIDPFLREWVEQNKGSNPQLIHDLDPVRYLWVPELNGRYTLRNLHTLAEEVQTQQDFSKSDTAVGLAVVGLVSVPALAGEGLITACLAWATDTFFLGQTLIAEVPDFVYKRQDVKFALGAHLVLGGDRLSEALLKETKWYELFFAVAPAAFSNVFVSYQTASAIRAARTLPKVKAGGVAAFKLLSEVDQAAVIREMSEAKLLQEYGQAKALNSSQRSAEEVADALIGKAGADPSATPKLTPEPAIDALGEAGPHPTPEPEPDLSTVPPERTPKYTPFEVPAPKPTTVELETLAKLAPEPGKPWKTVYNRKIVTFELGPQIGEESAYSRNFRLINPDIPECEVGCIIKTLDPIDRQAALDTIAGGKLLEERIGDAILQPKLIVAEPNAPRPYMIVEELRPIPGELVLLNYDESTMALFRADPSMGDAFLEGFFQLKEAGLAWPDAHLKNWYLKKVNGKWRAGILDPDMITPFEKMNNRVAEITRIKHFQCFMECGSLSQSRQGVFKTLREDWAAKTFGKPFEKLTLDQKLVWARSRTRGDYFYKNPGSLFPDVETATEKIMELDWFFKTDPNTGERVGFIIDPGQPLNRAKWEPKFPKMFEAEHYDPIEATGAGGFYNP